MAVTQIRGSSQIIGESILAAQLAANSVITVKILDKNVTTEKLADGAVTELKLGANAVTNEKIADGAVTTTEIASNAAITLGQLARGADIILKDGTVPMAADLAMGSHKISGLVDGTLATDAVTKGYIDTQVSNLQSAMASGMVYRGSLDASAAFSGQAPAGALSVGDFFMVTVAGDLGGLYDNVAPELELSIGDMLVVNKAVAEASAAVKADFDRVDNTDTVTSVAGRFGTIVLTKADITDLTASAAEINYLAGVTSGVQAQIDAKLDDSQLKTDATMVGATDAEIPSRLAVKTYVDNATTVAVGAFAVGETPVGLVDGTNPVYTLAQAPKALSLAVYLNGMRLLQGGTNDYIWVSGLTFTMLQVPQTGDILTVDYRY